MSDIFYDDEQHRNEEYAEDGRNGCAKDDGDAHRLSGDEQKLADLRHPLKNVTVPGFPMVIRERHCAR